MLTSSTLSTSKRTHLFLETGAEVREEAREGALHSGPSFSGVGVGGQLLENEGPWIPRRISRSEPRQHPPPSHDRPFPAHWILKVALTSSLL